MKSVLNFAAVIAIATLSGCSSTQPSPQLVAVEYDTTQNGEQAYIATYLYQCTETRTTRTCTLEDRINDAAPATLSCTGGYCTAASEPKQAAQTAALGGQVTITGACAIEMWLGYSGRLTLLCPTDSPKVVTDQNKSESAAAERPENGNDAGDSVACDATTCGRDAAATGTGTVLY
jgi:hypothetical protein